MKECIYVFFLCVFIFFNKTVRASEPPSEPQFKVLALTERGGGHESFVAAALQWLHAFAKANNFEITEINNTQKIDAKFLSEYKLFIQLDFPPYRWSDESKAAFVDYIEHGKGGWIGFHHATLLGNFDGYPMWQWFSDFMGGIIFKNYIAKTASGTVHVEDPQHPVMKNVQASFVLHDDEWYTFDKNPRPNVHVLATVDESSYNPPSDIKMGDHPVIWTNPKMKARNVYFLMGHHASLFQSADFTTMFGNAILWATEEKFEVSEPRSWNLYPPEAQKRGFGLHKYELVQMDDDPALELVLLFSANNGHYPYFDLFKIYYVIVDNYNKKIKYMSDVVISTEREIVLEDRNNDGKFELYRRYIKDGEFSTDKKGNNLSAEWVYDTIEFK
jgi:type 1 glutamine amidotransferase